MQGNTSAFEVLVERYERVLFNVAFRLTNNAEDARDVTQNAFVRAYEKLDTYDPGRPFFSWLYRIGINESLNYRRARRVHEPLARAASAAVDDDTAARVEMRRDVQHALMALGVSHREVVVLKYFADLSYVEIGQALGLPEKTVKSRLFEARRLLEASLSESAE